MRLVLIAAIHFCGAASTAAQQIPDTAGDDTAAVISSILAAVRSSNVSERLAAAEAGVALMVRHQDRLGQEIDTGRRLGGTVIASLFQILTASFKDETNHCVVPPLHPPLRAHGLAENPAPGHADAGRFMARRHELHGELCSLALLHPEWAEDVLFPLTNAWLMSGLPTRNDLQKYMQNVVKARGGRVASMLDAWVDTHLWGQPGEHNAEQWRKLLRLAMQFAADALRAGGPAHRGQLAVVTLIANEVRRDPVGQGVLMDELWGLACAGRDAVLREEVFPVWVSCQLERLGSADRCLEIAQEFASHPVDPYLMRAIINECTPADLTCLPRLQRQIELADLVMAVIAKTPALLENDEVVESVVDAARSLAFRGVNTDKPFLERAAVSQKRMLDMLASLTDPPAEAHFHVLGRIIITHGDTHDARAKLAEKAARSPEATQRALIDFIRDGSGRWQAHSQDRPEGHLGGCWDLGCRIEWYDAALHVGKVVDQRLRNTKWLQPWLHELSLRNPLVHPMVPPVTGSWYLRGFHVKRDAPDLPEPELLRMRDDLFLSGQETALARDQGDFGDYAALLLSRTPPESERVLQWLGREPDKMKIRLIDLLSSTRDSDDARLAAASLVEHILRTMPDSISGEHAVFDYARESLMETRVSPIKGMRWDSYLAAKSDISHEKSSTRALHAAWLQIVHTAMSMPYFEPCVFADFAQLHLTGQPEQVLASLKRVLSASEAVFDKGMTRIFKQQEALAPPDRRVEWARMLLRMLPELKSKNALFTTRQAEWINAFASFCQSGRGNSNSPEWEELSAAKKALISAMTDAHGFSIGVLNVYLERRFSVGITAEAVAQEMGSALRGEEGKVPEWNIEWARQISALCSRLARDDTSTKERIWSAAVLLELDRFWPLEWNNTPLVDASFILHNAVSKDRACEFDALQMQVKFVEAVQRRPVGASCGAVFCALGRLASEMGAGLDVFEAQCLLLAQGDPHKASAILAACWRAKTTFFFEQPEDTLLSESALRVLRDWPQGADPSSLEWTTALIDAGGDRRSQQANTPEIIGRRRSLVIVSPASKPGGVAFQTAVLAELQKRELWLPWMDILNLRRASHAGQDLTLFFSPTKVKVTVAYLTEVLSFDLQNSAFPGYGNAIMSEQYCPPHTNAAECMESARIVLSADVKHLLPPETASALRSLALKVTMRIIELGNEAAIKASRIRNGTWNGAVHPRQKESAEALLVEIENTAK